MKTLKLMLIFLLSLTISSCSSDDDSSEESAMRVTDFFATINGGTFMNYQSVLGSVFASSTEGTLTIAVTDSNANVVRIFINGTNELRTGSENIIGQESSQGFINSVVVRDQANEVTYNSISGSIIIFENVIDQNDDDISYVTGNFRIILNAEMSSEPVTLEGTFENIRFVNQL